VRLTRQAQDPARAGPDPAGPRSPGASSNSHSSPSRAFFPEPPGASGLLESARRLLAVTVEVDAVLLPDLVRAGGHLDRQLWSRSGLTILGTGVALRLALPAGWAEQPHTQLLQEALSAVRTEGHETGLPGQRPLAMGALPYDPSRPGHLTIPRLVVTSGHGHAWATLTMPHHGREPRGGWQRIVEEELAALANGQSSGGLPDRFELAAGIPHDDWKRLVARAVSEMERGSMSKVVLARQVDVVANRPFVLPETLARLAQLYPSCAVFHVEGFLGASPEVLLRRTGHEIESHPLAGTVARSGDPATDEALVAALMSSSKDRREHELVVGQIVGKLRPRCAWLDVPPEPSVMPLRNVSHLGTHIRGTLREIAVDGTVEDTGQVANGKAGGDDARPLPPGRDLPTSLELAALLQPTPAVGGLPVDAALRWQRDNEGFDRGCYAGPVGWVDSSGDGEWALGLRSAHVSGNRATLYAGNGIVAGSDPDAELAETQLKLQALLAALVRP